MFQSSYMIMLSTFLTTFVIVWYTLRTNPFQVLTHFLRDFFANRKVMIHFLAMLAILFFNKIELWVERLIDIKGDFTHVIYQFEGDFVYMIQKYLENDVLTYFFTYFYVVVFTSLLIASLFIYHYGRDFHSFYALFYGVMMNYMLAIPFFLFFPVLEVWYYHPDVRFLILDVYPQFETGYRNLSGIDNCFPSLHTSLSITMAAIAMRSNNPRFARIATISAGVIIFSIFYLGIHWLSDMAAGTMMAMFISTVAVRVAESVPAGTYSMQTETIKKQRWM